MKRTFLLVSKVMHVGARGNPWVQCWVGERKIDLLFRRSNLCTEFKGSALGKINTILGIHTHTIQAPCISEVTNRRVNSYSNSH